MREDGVGDGLPVGSLDLVSGSRDREARDQGSPGPAPLRARRESGDRSWDRFKCFRGGSGLFEDGVRLVVEAAVLQGKDVAERRSCTTYPESPILHGKEGVDGSSPSEGFEKTL